LTRLDIGYAFEVEPVGQSFAEIAKDLEVLKLALIEMTPADIDQKDAAGVAQEISAIRLQLKRLEADRRTMQ
jgi:hypothetical protein